jgi:hypothetical protein
MILLPSFPYCWSAVNPAIQLLILLFSCQSCWSSANQLSLLPSAVTVACSAVTAVCSAFEHGSNPWSELGYSRVDPRPVPVIFINYKCTAFVEFSKLGFRQILLPVTTADSPADYPGQLPSTVLPLSIEQKLNRASWCLRKFRLRET